MVTNEVIINGQRCEGCGYCVEFCPNGSLEMDTTKVSPIGYYHPKLTKTANCSGCGICAWMCPHWAIQVVALEASSSTIKKEVVAGPPRLAQDPPLAGCPGCQHPTLGRLVAEAVDELGIAGKAVVFEAIPCSISSAFGMDFGRKLTHDESAPDIATYTKRKSPESIVAAVQGYWGLADFSFNVGSFIGALIRGENITLILSNMPFYAPKDARPAPEYEPAAGRLEPATRINTPEGQKLIMGGNPLHLAEMASGFKGVSYSARGAMTSAKDYRQTKNFIKKALQKQVSGGGLSYVEVLAVCGDLAYSVPVESLKWVEQKMAAEFPLGEFKNEDRG
jgi:2-oxoglutarate/2-oxoacid ferredoxin oxidoreductase subunit beta